MSARFPTDHPVIPAAKTGVLLINLGTPDGTGFKSMRRYLGEFLSDRRVIELSPLLWQPILQGIILNTRPGRSGEAYEKIWNKAADESPLRTFSKLQTKALAERLRGFGEGLVVDYAMRYGRPSTPDKIDHLAQQGCTRIVLVALYPQYSATTTATAYDKAFRHLQKMRWQPAVRTTPPYHDDPAYIDALASSLEAHLAGLDWVPEKILASFHGLPQEYLEKGDPYHCHCHKTTRLLKERLAPDIAEKLMLTFQSRFGPKQWLQPYTDVTVEHLAGQGVKKLAIICPGFAADCVETLEEIDIGVRELFGEKGGSHFTQIPCLNASEAGIDIIERIVRRELAGWMSEPVGQQEAAE